MIGSSLMTEAEITDAQRHCRTVPAPRTRSEYRAVARWWELEARRGYASSSVSLRYAANMRWAAQVAGETGPGTWLELRKRIGEGP